MANAQTGTVKGFVYDKETGEPFLFANVFLEGTSFGASTDLNGFYQITKVPAGDYVLKSTFIGMDTATVSITLKENGSVTKALYVSKSSIQLDMVEISAEKMAATTEVRTSVARITPKEMKQVPTIGAEADLAQVLTVQPGVIFTGDQGGQIYIRGGSPVQNKVLLDGMIVYNPFHSIGLFSVFDTDIIRSADIYTGGFNAEFGDRISSVMDIKTRDGNKKRLSGKLSVSPFGANALLEGPILKLRDDKNGSISFLLSGKASFLEQTSKALYTYIDTGGLPFNYADFYGKVSFNSKNGSKVNVFGFSYNDDVTYRSVSNYKWNSWGIGTNFLVVPAGSNVLMEGFINYSDYKISLSENEIAPRQSQIGGFNVGMNFLYYMGKNELKYGVFLQGFQTSYSFANSLGAVIGADEAQNTTDFGAFAKFKWNIKEKLIIEPSFRLHYYASLAVASPEPRLGLKWNIANWFRFKYAFGLFSQNLISANSDRDVVNLFYGFLTAPENLPSEFDGKEITDPLQRAMHNIAGFEIDLGKRVSINVEGYWKNFYQLSNVNRNKLFDESDPDAPDNLKKDFIIETGEALGVDFVAKYSHKRLYFWAVYSLGYVKRYDGITEYFPHFDRRHNVNLMASYTFGKNLDWEVGVRWNMGSGFPFTKTGGFYENVQVTSVGDDVIGQNGNLGVEYGELNSGRLPYYHRLDLNIKKTFSFGKNHTLDVAVGMTNVYNRENVFYFDRIKYERVNQLPILPSLGLSWNF
ncbi:MAG: hypothetical protein ACI9FU_002387 [Granulosicoccus sp.]|jgi:hypothetical protein